MFIAQVILYLENISKVFSREINREIDQRVNGCMWRIHNRFIIKPQFENVDDVHGFNLGLSAVKKNGKFGFIIKRRICH